MKNAVLPVRSKKPMDLITEKLCKEEFPFLLKQTSQLPQYIYISGKLPSDDYKFLCVVGSRNHTAYGKEACEKLIEGLKGYPIVIVSGLAIGMDSIAHEAALKAGLLTIAFPGSGLSRETLYPSSRRDLARRILESGGTLMSPFEHDQYATEWTFPKRNRLMAGISHATLIIEAGEKSGTMITARNALDFNRDVLIVPGSIFSELSHTPLSLLKDGAIPVSSSKDILVALGFEVLSERSQQTLLELMGTSMTDDEKKLVEMLKVSPLSGTDLVEKMSIPATSLNILLSGLELKGVIKQFGDTYKIKN